MHAVRDAQVPLEKVLPHEAPVLERRTDLARERLAAFMARLVPLALVLPQELHSTTTTWNPQINLLSPTYTDARQ